MKNPPEAPVALTNAARRVDKADYRNQAFIAKHTQDLDLLSALVASSRTGVRAAAAKNPRLTNELARRLAQDKSQTVLRHLLAHPRVRQFDSFTRWTLFSRRWNRHDESNKIILPSTYWDDPERKEELLERKDALRNPFYVGPPLLDYPRKQSQHNEYLAELLFARRPSPDPLDIDLSNLPSDPMDSVCRHAELTADAWIRLMDHPDFDEASLLENPACPPVVRDLLSLSSV